MVVLTMRGARFVEFREKSTWFAEFCVEENWKNFDNLNFCSVLPHFIFHFLQIEYKKSRKDSRFRVLLFINIIWDLLLTSS